MEVGQVWERQSGPPLRVTVLEGEAPKGYVASRMTLNGRSFGERPCPLVLLDGKHFALVEVPRG